MSRKMLKRMVAGVLAVCAAGALVLRVARATPPHGVINTLMAGPVTFDEIHAMTHFPDYTALVKTRGLSDGYVRYLKIAPGGDTGWHSHPGIIFGLVQSGTLTFYHDDGTRSVFPAGTGFVESPGDVHNSVNEGTADLEMAVFFLVPKGAPPRIDEPAP
ncbi:MAG: cupin domain-containing protein [Planctomycetia bacterium]|nr:cupin domain-containing protein [Planctomycetia bacterium]